MEENQIIVTIITAVLILTQLASAVAKIRIVDPQDLAVLMTFNNRRTAISITDLRIVVAGMFQEMRVYSGEPVPLTIASWDLPVNTTTHGTYNVTFRNIQPIARITDAAKAFFHAPNRTPLPYIRVIVTEQLAEILSNKEWGDKFRMFGLGVIQAELLQRVIVIANKWGATLDELSIGDFDATPFDVKAAEETAMGYAEAKRYRITKDEQKGDWYLHEILDAWKASGLKAFSIGGGNIGVAEIIGALQTALHINEEEKK